MSSPEGLSQILPDDEVPYFALAQQFERAAAIGPLTELRVLIARRPIRIRVAGAEWGLTVSKALSHLPPAPAEPEFELTVDVWDSKELRLEPAWRSDPTGPPTLMKTSSSGHYIGEERHHGALWFDRRKKHIVGHIDGTGQLSLDARARPFHKLLSAWLWDEGVQFVHAGLVSSGERGLLLVGNGGAGKSTASIAALMAGMDYLGDDFVGFSQDGNQVTGFGFYASCLLDRHHILNFPQLADASLAPNLAIEHKNVAFLGERLKPQLRHECSVQAIAMPRVIPDPRSSFEPAKKIEALRAIAPTSVMYLPRPSKEAFHRLSDMVNALPCYWFNSGSNIDAIGETIRTFVENPTRRRCGNG